MVRVRKGFAPAIVALIIIVLIAVGYAYAASRRHSAVTSTYSTPPSPSPPPTPSPSPSPTPTPSPTSRRYYILARAYMFRDGELDLAQPMLIISDRERYSRNYTFPDRPVLYVEVYRGSTIALIQSCNCYQGWTYLYVDVTRYRGEQIYVVVKVYNAQGRLIDSKEAFFTVS